MQIGPVHLQLNLSRNSRKRNMRDNILRNAEQLHKRGLDSRIPFLKFACLGEKVVHGSTANKEDGRSLPEWKEGDIVSGSCIDDVIRFNIFNAQNRLQALKSSDNIGSECSIRIVRCETIWYGDMRINHVSDDCGIELHNNANFDWNINQIIIGPKDHWSRSTFLHECEHARHMNLIMMSSLICPTSFRTSPLAQHTSEYLSMLVDTNNTMTITILKLFPQILKYKGQVPYVRASLSFISNLIFRYLIDPRDLIKTAIKLRKENSWDIDENIRRKIHESAKSEYERMYQKIFSLSRADICEVIDSLPVI